MEMTTLSFWISFVEKRLVLLTQTKLLLNLFVVSFIKNTPMQISNVLDDRIFLFQTVQHHLQFNSYQMPLQPIPLEDKHSVDFALNINKWHVKLASGIYAL